MHIKKTHKNALLSGIIVFLLILRAWPRLLYPHDIWIEDGTVNLYGFLTRGLSFFTEPLNGYFVLIPKIITAISASISASFYPEIATTLSFLLTVGILVSIARFPLHLRGGFLLPALFLLIPAWAEGFGLPLYSFWWASLPLLAFVFWDEREAARHVWLRIIVIGLASLSAPICLVTLPLFWARVLLFWEKPNRNYEIHIACWATLFAAIQLIPVWTGSKAEASQNLPIAFAALDVVVVKFLGGYVLGNIVPRLAKITGIAVLLYIVVGMFRHWRHVWLWALCYLWLASILMIVVRINIHGIGPMEGGPRYFFYVYPLLGWLILQFTFIDKNRWIRLAGIMLLIVSVVNAMPCLFAMKKHDELHWRNHLISCQHFPDYTIPIHFVGGSAHYPWRINLSGERCKQIAAGDPFISLAARGGTFPYRVVSPKNLSAIAAPTDKDIVANNWQSGADWTATDKNPDIPPGWESFESLSATGIRHNGVFSIRLHRGDCLLFTAGSRLERQRIVIAGHSEFTDTTPFWKDDTWAVLEFSNDLLPEIFVVNFYDNGSEPAEWSAVAIRKDQQLNK